MVTLEPGRRAAGGRSGVRARRRRRARGAVRRAAGPGPEPRRAGAGGLWPPGGRPPDEADPAGRRAGRGIGGRGGRAALGRVYRPRRGGPAGRRRAVLPGGGAGPGRGRGGEGHAAPVRAPRATCCSCHPSAWRRPGSTGPGTRIPGTEGPNALDRRGAGRRAPPGGLADALGEWAGREPVLAGSGSTWFVERRGGQPGRSVPDELRVGAETARLVRARTVPAGWEGD